MRCSALIFQLFVHPSQFRSTPAVCFIFDKYHWTMQTFTHSKNADHLMVLTFISVSEFYHIFHHRLFPFLIGQESGISDPAGTWRCGDFTPMFLRRHNVLTSVWHHFHVICALGTAFFMCLYTVGWYWPLFHSLLIWHFKFQPYLLAPFLVKNTTTDCQYTRVFYLYNSNFNTVYSTMLP